MARSTGKSLALYLASPHNTDSRALECNFEMNLGKNCMYNWAEEKYNTAEVWNSVKGDWAWSTKFDVSIDYHRPGNILYRAVNQSLSHGTGYFNCLR
jgi:hypothetical protein